MQQITICKPKFILEIGVFEGVHAKQMIECAQKFSKNVIYYGFDLFEDYTKEIKKIEGSKAGNPIYSEIKKNLERTGAIINLYKGFTRDTLPKFVREEGPLIDFIFIDGGHSLETIANDWFWCLKLMHKQTIVIFDDYWHNRLDFGCKKLIDNISQISSLIKFKAQILEPTDIFPDRKINFVKVTFA